MQNKAAYIIRKTWVRPSSSVIDRFRGVPTALIADAMGHGFGVVDFDIRPVWDGPDFVGPALPVETAPHDILAVHVGVKYSLPGDVIVIATGRYMKAAVMGEMTTTLLRSAGIVAGVTDGVVRDLREIVSNGLPVYAAGISPGIPFKNGPGRVGLPVSVGGIAISPGDIVVGDRDGVVVVPWCFAERTLEAIEDARRIDLKLGAVMAGGTKVPPHVEQSLADTEVHYVD